MRRNQVLHLHRLNGLTPAQRLWGAVIAKAAEDLRSGNGHAGDARQFFEGEGFQAVAQGLGFDAEWLRRRLVRTGELPPAGVT